MIILLITIIGLTVALRQQILNRIISQKTTELYQKYGIRTEIEQTGFNGISDVFLNKILFTKNADTLLFMDSLSVNIKLKPLLWGTLHLERLSIDKGKLVLSDENGQKNYSFLYKDNTSKKTATEAEKDFAQMLHKFIDQVANKIPDNLYLNDFRILLKQSDSTKLFWLKQTELQNGLLNGCLVQPNKEQLLFNGTLEREDKSINLTVYPAPKKFKLPSLLDKEDTKFEFDTLKVILNGISYKKNKLTLNGGIEISQAVVKHPNISDKNISIPKLRLNANIRVEKNSFALDSTSTAEIGKITLYPLARYQHYPNKTYRLELYSNLVEAQDFFDALPKGMFESVEGIAVQGKLKYNMKFFLDEENPRGCEFVSALEKENFTVLKQGEADLYKLNRPFIYTPYENNMLSRDIWVGQSNPNYVSLEDVSPYLKNAVLSAEDADFFYHKGFNEEALRFAIADDFIAKRFKRGGSTVSMQLIKNVYLSRNKTISRKLEEMLLVWLIENNRLVSKERMFEVYLNIIEWGPNVYGISEAAQFYFNKRPQSLTLSESIFLASIIPSPKKYRSKLDAEGNLRYGVGSPYYNFISSAMIKRGHISEEERDGMENICILF